QAGPQAPVAAVVAGPQGELAARRRRDRGDDVGAAPGREEDLPDLVLRVEAGDDAALDDRRVEQPALPAHAHERDHRPGARREDEPEVAVDRAVRELEA